MPMAEGKAKIHYTFDNKCEEVARPLAEFAPNGLNNFFDNVGGEILDAALGNLGASQSPDLWRHVNWHSKPREKWIANGELAYAVDILEGIENAPAGLRRVFEGKNLGKQLVTGEFLRLSDRGSDSREIRDALTHPKYLDTHLVDEVLGIHVLLPLSNLAVTNPEQEVEHIFIRLAIAQRNVHRRLHAHTIIFGSNGSDGHLDWAGEDA